MERCNGRRTGRASKSLIPGLILTAAGVVFLLDNLNIIYLDEWWHYWPVLLIVVGFVKLVDNVRVLDRASS
jgi:hypothetical protein